MACRKPLVIILPILVWSLLGWLYYRALWGKGGEPQPVTEPPLEGWEETAPAPDFFPPQPLEGKDSPAPSLPGEPLPSPEPLPPPAPFFYSDSQSLKEAASLLTENPLLRGLLANRHFARAFVRTLDAMAHGEPPSVALLPGLPVELPPFRADRSPGYLAPSSSTSQRLTPWVGALCAIPPEKAAQWLHAASPILQEELLNLGDSQADFQQTLVQAMDQVLNTPLFDFPPELLETGRPGHYDYKDPVFQSLNPLQKALVRTGYENCGKLREYAASLKEAWENP